MPKDTDVFWPIPLNAYIIGSNPMGAAEQWVDLYMDENLSDDRARPVKSECMCSPHPEVHSALRCVPRRIIVPARCPYRERDGKHPGNHANIVHAQMLPRPVHNRQHFDGHPERVRNQSVTFCSPDGNKRRRRFVLWVSKPVCPRQAEISLAFAGVSEYNNGVARFGGWTRGPQPPAPYEGVYCL